MRRVYRVTTAFACVLLLAPTAARAQGDPSRAIPGGGVNVSGWTGKIDEREERNGLVLASAKFDRADNGFHVLTGPAVTYWNPANTATGEYTVRATFREPAYMAHNNHPHPYGVVIAGNDMGTGQQSYLYCAAYGNGNFIVRGFGPQPFQLNGPRGGSHEAVSRAAGAGEAVTQEIAISVRGGKVECAINGTVVASYDRSEVIADGRLKSTDGMYGLRFGHNTEAYVTGFSVTRH